MRSFLLTWYGITDFRASLGFEDTEGPITAAIRAEPYSDIVILGYTRLDDDSDECAESQKSFAPELQDILDAGFDKDWETTSRFVEKYANTTVAHGHFLDWLKKKAQDAGIETKIQLQPEKLRELNDTEGIYACAIGALDRVKQISGENQVTLYLSPGTPVMAFVWALAALRHPDLDLKLIASPVIGKPPANIPLPSEWRDQYGTKSDDFDVILHLFGEQRIPSLLGIRQFNSKRHVFVNSESYPATCMRRFIGDSEFAELPVNPWDARAVREKINHYVNSYLTGCPNARIGINLTGGTKLMFAGALMAARRCGIASFYFDGDNRLVRFFDSSRCETIQPIESTETLLLVNTDGLCLSNTGKINGELLNKRFPLTNTLWKQAPEIKKHYFKLNNFISYHTKNGKQKPLPIVIELKDYVFKFEPNGLGTPTGYKELDSLFKNQIDFARYLCGGWLEEYTYWQFKPFEDRGLIKDIRMNVKFDIDLGHPNSPEYNELDVVFTDGYSLYIVECKAGEVELEQIMKCQNLVRTYGGVNGRGIIACRFTPDDPSKSKKIIDARLTLCSESVIHRDKFAKDINSLMNAIAARTRTSGATK